MLELEALRHQLVQSTGASMDIEESITRCAMEVVVVLGSHACQFVSITATGNAHDGDLSILLKSADGSVDRTKSQ